MVAVAAFVALAACSGKDNFRDVEGVKSQRPELIEVYNNVDQHPNIARVCIKGVAFATTTRQYEPVIRVPEWDRDCPGHKSG